MRVTLSVFASLSVIVLACTSGTTPNVKPDAAPPPPDQVTFAPNMLWGSSTAGFQVEKGNTTSDWGHWVETAGKIKNGDKPDVGGPDAFAHMDDDIALLKSTGQNAYRFSIELSRVYPTRAAFDTDVPDAAAITAYTTLLAKLKTAGITPMVTLQHFALPDWLSDITKPNDPQGWERPDATTVFSTWCTRMGNRFGGSVDWWVTINEPFNLVLGGYVQGSFPPGLILALDRAFAVAKTEVFAHAKCVDALRAADTIDADGDGKATLVSYAAHLRTFHPFEDGNPEDQAAADRVRYLWNDWFLNAVVKGDFDENLDGKLDGPKDKTADPTLKGRMDWIGVNYYSDTLLSATRGVKVPVINAAVFQDNLPNTRPKSDFAWDIYPEGLGTVLDEVQPYGLPVVITENGVADSKDVMRARFIAEHLYQLGWARQRGVDVRGYIHWALIDNFEWASGYCPKFGLASFDSTTGKRTLRTSADTYKQIIAAGGVSKSFVAALPPYGAPTTCN